MVLKLHALGTLGMFGVIWIVQLLLYPSFSSSTPHSFIERHQFHMARISFIVIPLMMIEIVTAVLLLMNPPMDISSVSLWFGFILLAITWLSTAFIQVPLHRALEAGYNEAVIQRLVQTNWIRTVAWTMRAGLIIVWL